MSKKKDMVTRVLIDPPPPHCTVGYVVNFLAHLSIVSIVLLFIYFFPLDQMSQKYTCRESRWFTRKYRVLVARLGVSEEYWTPRFFLFPRVMSMRGRTSH